MRYQSLPRPVHVACSMSHVTCRMSHIYNVEVNLPPPHPASWPQVLRICAASAPNYNAWHQAELSLASAVGR